VSDQAKNGLRKATVGGSLASANPCDTGLTVSVIFSLSYYTLGGLSTRQAGAQEYDFIKQVQRQGHAGQIDFQITL